MAKLILSVTPEELENQAEKVRSIRERYDEILEEMNAMFHAFDGRLKQESTDSCVAYFDSKYDAFAGLSDVLERYAETMRYSAKFLRELEIPGLGPVHDQEEKP